MNRSEALHILGLDTSATEDDIKAAYKETAQILHPDRFAGNKRLQNRATEQFKTLQEAYELLNSTKPSSGRSSQTGAGYSRASELEARLAGIAAAREQLVAQRDALLDTRKRGVTFIVVGAVLAFLLRFRIPALAGIAGALAVWGIVDVISSMSGINDLGDQLTKLKKEKQQILEELEDLE